MKCAGCDKPLSNRTKSAYCKDCRDTRKAQERVRDLDWRFGVRGEHASKGTWDEGIDDGFIDDELEG